MKEKSLVLIAIVSALTATPIHAEIVGPYTVDANTLHLYHFDEAGGSSTADAAGSINVSAQSGATLGNAGFNGFGNAGDTGAASNSILRSSVVSPGPVAAPVGAGGAFTYEAMINISTTSGSQHIFSMDANSNSNRIFWLRIVNGDLQFFNLKEGSLNSYNTTIPTTGDDAFVANEWFHVAVTYDGNENSENNLNLYWTRVDVTRTEANLIGSHTMADDLSTTARAIYGIGNDFRTVGSGNQGNLEGGIDEVRISGIARAEDDMLFSGPPAPPENFIYHDSATTDGGEFSGNFLIANLKNGGYTSASATENADAGGVNLSYATTNPPAGGYPVTITLEFDSPASLEAFHLWNHSNVGSDGARNQGVKDFTLTFYDEPGGAGSAIGSPFSASAAKAPLNGTYPAESFTFGSAYTGVRSVVFTADNHNPGASFVAMREIGFTGTTTPVPPATPDRVIVYLVGGQSNADGYGITSQLAAEWQAPQPAIDFYHGNGGGNSPLTANQAIRLQPGSGSMTGNAGGFGPELSFGIGIHEALGSGGARIAVIKHTLGGTSLHTDWFPGGDNTTSGDGPVYEAFQTTVSNGLDALAALYPAASIQFEGMIWHQGESDAGNATVAGTYQANLTNFIADVRATYGSGLKFGIVQLSDSQTSLNPTHLATVKGAQAAVADADPLSYLVTTDDLPMGGSSGIHFGTSGNLTIGTRLATGMRQMPITDVDGNGLDDDWEEFHWGTGNVGQDPSGDDDRDGLSNLEEFLWQTDPLVSNVVAPELRTAPVPSISWPSSPDRRYLIEVSTDLETWQRLDSFIPGGAGSSTSYDLPEAPERPKQFFRVGVHR